MNFLQMSLSGGVLICVVLLLRILLVNRFPKRLFPFLWGICLVRLLLPFSIASDFSVYSLGMHFLSRNGQGTVRIAESPLANLLPGISVKGGMAEKIVPSTAAGFSFAENLPGLLWLTGFLFFVLFFGICYLTCLRNYQTSLPISTDFTEKWLGEHPLRRTISIRRSDLVTSPLTYGFFKPVILLPKTVALDKEEQLNFIFLHEYIHIRRLDALAKLFMIAALCLHWFNPLVWLMYHFFNRDLELTCDEAVVRFSGTQQRANYARTLVSMEAQRSVPTLLFNSFSKNTIEERIIAIMKPKKLTLFGGIAAVALVLCIGTCFLTSASAAEKAQPGQSATNDALLKEAETQLEELQAELEKLTSEIEALVPVTDGIADETSGLDRVPGAIPDSETASDFVSGTDTGTASTLVTLMTWPTESTHISSAYSKREHPLTSVSYLHDHVDIAGSVGDDVYAALSGTIAEVGFDAEGGRGNYLILTTPEGIQFIYGQLSETLVFSGDEVTAGTVIAYLGNTGQSTGPHLSFGVFVDGQAVDPMTYFK